MNDSSCNTVLDVECFFAVVVLANRKTTVLHVVHCARVRPLRDAVRKGTEHDASWAAALFIEDAIKGGILMFMGAGNPHRLRGLYGVRNAPKG